MAALSLIVLFVSLGAFGILSWLTNDQTIYDWEVALLQWSQNLTDYLEPFFVIVTQLGGVYVLAVILVLFLLWRNKFMLQLLVAGSISSVLVWFGKRYFGRGRPDTLLNGIDVKDLLWSGNGGFPSGHTALAVSLGIILIANLPKQYRLPVILAVVLVASSRIYLGVHFPLDLLGGAALGIIAALLSQPVTNLTASFFKKH